MNKILIGFNIVLAAAVIYLFATRPSVSNEPEKKEVKLNAAFAGDKGKGDLRIAYLNLDSLNETYQLFKDEAQKLQGIVAQIEQEIQQKQQTAMAKSQALQKDFELKTKSEQQYAYATLQKIENDFMVFKNRRSGYVDSLQIAISQKGEASLKKFLKTFCAEKKIDFVLRDGYASAILYGDNVFNITRAVADGLNAEYKKD
jgi:Skp family chaperone for outer membrane proteins